MQFILCNLKKISRNGSVTLFSCAFEFFFMQYHLVSSRSHALRSFQDGRHFKPALCCHVVSKEIRYFLQHVVNQTFHIKKHCAIYIYVPKNGAWHPHKNYVICLSIFSTNFQEMLKTFKIIIFDIFMLTWYIAISAIMDIIICCVLNVF